MTMDTSKVLRLPRKLQHIFWKRRKRIAPATQNDFRHVAERLNVTKCHACHAKRNNDTLETSKNDHLCRTSHRHGHTEFVRTVADGCGWLRPQTQRRANTPSTPRVKREPFLRIREKWESQRTPYTGSCDPLPSIFFCVLLLLLYPQVGPWPAVGRKPLNPAMPRRMVVWEKRCWNYKLLLEVDLRSFLNNFLTIFCCVREAKRS